MPFDKQKNQRKGFCFITFDSEQVVNELLKTPKQTISGKEVDVKKATPKPDNMPMGMIRGGGRGGRGGRGGGRGLFALHFFFAFQCDILVIQFFFRPHPQEDMVKVDGVTKGMVTDKVMATVAVMMVTAAAVATTIMAVMVDMVDIQTIRDTQIMVNTLTHQTKAITTHKRVITTNKISNIKNINNFCERERARSPRINVYV